MPNVLGETEIVPSPGYAEFELGGKRVQLDGVLETEDATEIWFILRDETSGQETYPGGRFLYSELPKAGRIVLDFNKSYNPPCAFTAYATCPLPPRQNWMPVRVEAGELTYGKALSPSPILAPRRAGARQLVSLAACLLVGIAVARVRRPGPRSAAGARAVQEPRARTSRRARATSCRA